jgi:putative PIN family toxin of toxin-antitoxin system
MRAYNRIVADTNVFVSAIILPLSVPRQAVEYALDHSVLLLSESTLHELSGVVFRSKLDRYASRVERTRFLRQLTSTAEFVPIIQIIQECRDPKDDKFLEVALNGRADVIITGDTDLLRMRPWRETAIMSPSEYLER